MDNMYKGIIYKYISPSGKVYIGQTRDERNRRLRWFRMTSQYYAEGKLEAAKDCGINRNWFKEYLNGKDNHIHGKFIWKRKYE